jgi:hypothetical protein
MRARRQILPILLITVISLPGLAQRDRGRRSGGSVAPPPRAERDQGQPNRRDSQPASNSQGNTQAGQAGETRLRGPGPHNGDWLRRFGNMPEQEQRKQLQSDPNFQRLPKDRQQQLMRRLDNYNRMSPEQKERVLQRMETWEHYSPEQRARARQLFEKFRQFDPDSRQRVTSAVRRLHGMPPDARQNFYNSDAFRTNYNEDEQNVIKGLGELGPAESEPPEPPNK